MYLLYSAGTCCIQQDSIVLQLDVYIML
ncbi:uncharacterized protein METZ01_LOCUS371378 [marine metagenome]|uniref:Uncharacterized protein n=1 Tax=marine metagenome TaxID=408172 RepID=A0A382T8P7_9ZZZZ